MSLADHSVRALLEAFRAPEPSPGGGSASALAGAVGAALLAMVAGLPRRDADEGGETDLRNARAVAEKLSEELRLLIDRDSEAYGAVMSAYKLPKGTDDEKRIRSVRIQQALAEAIEIPLDIMRRCAEAIATAVPVAAHGNRNAWSDVRVALELLQAGLRGALANVEINLESLKDGTREAVVRAEAERLRGQAAQRAAEALRRL